MTRIYILLLFVMAAWGFNVSALSVLVNNIDPITLTSARIFTAGVGVLIVAKVIGILRLPTKQEWKTIGFITIFNVAFHHTFLAIGLTKTSGVNTGIILGAAPLVTMVLSIVFLHDRVTRLRAFGFLLGFTGIIITSLIGSDGAHAVSLGDGFIFMSMLFQAISFILISKLNPTFDPRLLTGYMLVVGSVFIFIVGLTVERDLSQLQQLFSLKLGSVFLFSAIIATALGHMIYNFAIKNVGPAETTIFINLNTLFALIGAAVFLGEPILMKHFTGLAFIVVGVFIGSGTLEYIIRTRKQKRRTFRQ